MENRIVIYKGDITKMDVAAIVNAANNGLLGGGGVDGAIHREGGPAILEECKEIRRRQGECPTGEAVVTTAGNLRAKYVIHTVGPIWKGGKNDEAALLSNCYRNSLELAVQHGCRSIAFPRSATGIYGYPKKEAATIAWETTVSFLSADDSIRKVIFVCYDEENFSIYRALSEKEQAG